MNVTSIGERQKAPNFGAHKPWKGRFVLWVTRAGVKHIARHSATVLRGCHIGIVSKVLCGGGSDLHPEGDTWYSQKRQGARFCRKCVRKLARCGESSKGP